MVEQQQTLADDFEKLCKQHLEAAQDIVSQLCALQAHSANKQGLGTVRELALALQHAEDMVTRLIVLDTIISKFNKPLDS